MSLDPVVTFEKTIAIHQEYVHCSTGNPTRNLNATELQIFHVQLVFKKLTL